MLKIPASERLSTKLVLRWYVVVVLPNHVEHRSDLLNTFNEAAALQEGLLNVMPEGSKVFVKFDTNF